LHAYQANKAAAPATTMPAPFKPNWTAPAVKVPDVAAAEEVAEPNEKSPVLVPVVVGAGPKLKSPVLEAEPVPLGKLNAPEAVSKLNALVTVELAAEAVLVMMVAAEVVPLPNELLVTVVAAALEPVEPEELEQLLFARQENWVESVVPGQRISSEALVILILHWNSPVPSTMISIPYPLSVLWVPAARSQGTFQT
jgi:hypothetical protein